ncbi:MAG: saccharopine dehydrogenase NADP-binding domain-containing protein [Anaerolineae bacterium]|nr:saccharopine dehydrogenase NADP-binding domain-containing protein [Anaerolineae bacterium]
MKTVLVLGAGLVTRPPVRYLLDLPNVRVIVASRTVSKAVALVDGHPQGEARSLNVKDAAALRAMVAAPEVDLVISFLPYIYHVQVAELCIEFGKNMVTTSYVSPAMQALDARAQAAGITLLNEIGVDPGIDHMSAMKIIHHVQENGGKVASFRSWCGGLPAPEANTNPLGYKFSWSPRGVLLAGRNAAHYLEDGKEINIAAGTLFKHHWPVPVVGMPGLEGYPNRDSVPYAEIYGITSAQTIFRGTLRNQGWCETMDALLKLGLVEIEEKDWGALTYKQLLGQLIGYTAEPDSDGLRQAVATYLGLEPDSFVLDNLAWLGLFSDDPLPLQHGGTIDILTACMLEKMSYAEGERDMLVMQHEFTAEYPDHTDYITSTMLDYGIPHGDTSMARTVGLPAAIATRMILEGKITRKGVLIPVTPDIYEPVMAELEVVGVHFEERVTRED